MTVLVDSDLHSILQRHFCIASTTLELFVLINDNGKVKMTVQPQDLLPWAQNKEQACWGQPPFRNPAEGGIGQGQSVPDYISDEEIVHVLATLAL